MKKDTVRQLKKPEVSAEWQKRALKGKQYVYIWVDGIRFGARKDASQCIC